MATRRGAALGSQVAVVGAEAHDGMRVKGLYIPTQDWETEDRLGWLIQSLWVEAMP